MPADCLIAIRSARRRDADALARVHEEAWRSAYQGLIPHLPLSRMIARRGKRWWEANLREGLPALLLRFDGEPAGYATYGRARMRGTPYGGEIFELYLRPDYQGVGLGKPLFEATRARLAERRLKGVLVWALADNEAACRFYLGLGGKPVSEGIEAFGGVTLRRVAFAWP